MQNKIYILVSMIIISSISACNRNTELMESIDDIPFNITCQTLIHNVGEGIDSKIGTLICDDVTFTYDYGRYSSSRPESLRESFSKSFYAYYYSKFFDAIYIDEKLREPFKDSVSIEKVQLGIEDKKYIVDCADCNATAFLEFNNISFLYPFIANDKVINNHRKYDISLSKSDDYYKKTYLSKETFSSGVFIAPLGNPRMHRLMQRLSVTTDHLPDKKIKTILQSIELKKVQ